MSCITWYDFPYHMISFDHVLQINAPIQAVVIVFDKKNAKEVLITVVVVIELDESAFMISVLLRRTICTWRAECLTQIWLF